MSMTTREVAKHIDAFKYWCDTNEENGVITIPKFICENIVKILDDNKQRPHGEWISVIGCDGRILSYKCKTCGWFKPHDIMPYCENCGADMRKEGEQNDS